MAYTPKVFFSVLLMCLLYVTDELEFKLCGDQSTCVNRNNCLYYVQVNNNQPLTYYEIMIQNPLSHCGFDNVYKKIQKVCCPKPQKEKKQNSLLLKKCGFATPRMTLYGPNQTQPGEFPWMALIAYKTEHFWENKFKCGGTLISKWYVLTAGHCVQDYKIDFVRLGEYNIETEFDCDDAGNCETVQDLRVTKIIVHPMFNSQTFANDIALIRLAAPANLDRSNVQPICLPTGSLMPKNLVGEIFIATGFGFTEAGKNSYILNKVYLPIKSWKTCLKVLKMPITNKQICAGGEMGMDTCNGDSGGPLQYITTINGSPRYVQGGIVSYGSPKCGLKNHPAVYTNVKSYIKWISDNMT